MRVLMWGFMELREFVRFNSWLGAISVLLIINEWVCFGRRCVFCGVIGGCGWVVTRV